MSMKTDQADRSGNLVPLAACLAVSLIVTGCSLKQRPYAFAGAPVPRMTPYGGHIGQNSGYSNSYGSQGAPAYPASPPAAEAWCDQVNWTYVGFGSAAAGSAVAAGSLGTIAGISDVDKNAQLGLAIGSGGLAVLSAIFSTISQVQGGRFQKQCPLAPGQ